MLSFYMENNTVFCGAPSIFFARSGIAAAARTRYRALPFASV